MSVSPFKMTKTGLIFDFDYTLVDSTEALYYCVNEVLERMQHDPVSHHLIETIKADTLEHSYQKLTGNDDPKKAANMPSTCERCKQR